MLAFVVIVSVGAYLLISAIRGHVGFPLDDAWIHQTYARNLALHGEWAFIHGQPSGGSTAPLWSALLAVGFWLKLAPYAWAFLLGAAALWGVAMCGEMAVRQLVPSYRPIFPWVGTVLALEWHLVWAASSGMETLLHALLVTVVLVLLILGSRRYFLLGLLIGLSTWVRPDGITLLGPALMVILLDRRPWSMRFRALTNLCLGFGSLFASYLLFNLKFSGSPWPNTFYAKQAEYASSLERPLLARFGQEAAQPLFGAGMILLPGVLLKLVSCLHRRQWGVVAAVIWVLGFLGLYAWRLPVTYQYGRYVMPVMPITFLLGLIGLVEFIRPRLEGWRWVVTELWKLSLAGILVVFWALGAFSYAKDVAFIDNEMVTTAQWVSENVPPGELVAAHDIGAMGYFGNHDLVDLAGLITPEVVPFIRNEVRISSYLDRRQVKYVIIFPDWYPQLVAGLQPVYMTSSYYAPGSGGSNMAVYRWPGP